MLGLWSCGDRVSDLHQIPRPDRPTVQRTRAEGPFEARLPQPSWFSSVLLLFDILDDLGHVVLVLAEIGGIFEELLVLLFGFFQRNGLLLLFFRDIGLLGLDIGI